MGGGGGGAVLDYFYCGQMRLSSFVKKEYKQKNPFA